MGHFKFTRIPITHADALAELVILHKFIVHYGMSWCFKQNYSHPFYKVYIKLHIFDIGSSDRLMQKFLVFDFLFHKKSYTFKIYRKLRGQNLSRLFTGEYLNLATCVVNIKSSLVFTLPLLHIIFSFEIKYLVPKHLKMYIKSYVTFSYIILNKNGAILIKFDGYNKSCSITY